MRLGVLGPLLVRIDDQPVQVASPKLRVVLTALVARNGQPVPLDQLADIAWDGSPPKTARATLRNHVKRLRRLLGQSGYRIRTSDAGYLIDLEARELDLLRFTSLCRDGGLAAESGDWAAASRTLAGALGLWRGVPFQDLPSGVLRHEVLPPLEQVWLQAAEGKVEADLWLGRHRELLPEVERLAMVHPLHERFQAQRILALCRCGRQAEALVAYEEVRRSLAEQLGTDPGEDLKQLYRRMLSADPGLLGRDGGPGAAITRPAVAADGFPPPLVPRQLPGVTRHFVGREGELRALTRLVTQFNGSGPVIAAVTGTAGSGKTTLANEFARSVAGQFPDGQLYVNLRGFDPGGSPLTATEAIRASLDALGFPGTGLPADVPGQAALYRSLLATRRLLIVLDNARDAEQVRPLLPGHHGCLVIITSRSQLTSLVATEGVYQLTAGCLTRHEARELIERYAEAAGGFECVAAGLLAEVCARLPLALVVAAARVAGRPAFSLTAFIDELMGPRPLDVLDAGDSAASVRAVFSWSYHALSPSAARLFRLLGLHPGPDISAGAAVSLAAAPTAQVRSDFAELLRVHLVTEHAPGRYSTHGLLRAYAAEQAHASESPAERHAVIRRMLDHYLHSGHAAARALSPGRQHPSLPAAAPGSRPEHPVGYAQAMSWFETERPVLPAVIDLAARARLEVRARTLAWALRTYLRESGTPPGRAGRRRG